ncbi:uncharacterized protein LOC144148992 [Haemaphysalis longicornis]
MASGFLTLSVVLGIAFGVVSSVSVFKDVPGCTAADAEKCGFSFIPFVVTERVAETAEQLQKDCKLFSGELECLQNFTKKCLDGLPKAVISIMIEASSDEYDILCDETAPRQKEYLDSAKCINRAGPEVRTCVQDFFVDLHRASKAPAKQQVAYSCCYYLDFLECTEKRLTSKCDLPAAIKYFKLIFENVLGDVLNVACSKYKKDSSACEALPPLSKKDDRNARGKAIIEPLASIAGSYLG